MRALILVVPSTSLWRDSPFEFREPLGEHFCDPILACYSKNAVHGFARHLACAKVSARAAVEGAEIHWGDETSLSTSDPRGRGFAPRGQTPVLTVVSRRKAVSFLSTVTNQGKVRFMVLEGPPSAQILIRFLRRLICDTNRRVFLILDNLNVHKAAKVRAWVEARCDAIEPVYLPTYAPELNPDDARLVTADAVFGSVRCARTQLRSRLTCTPRSRDAWATDVRCCTINRTASTLNSLLNRRRRGAIVHLRSERTPYAGVHGTWRGSTVIDSLCTSKPSVMIERAADDMGWSSMDNGDELGKSHVALAAARARRS